MKKTILFYVLVAAVACFWQESIFKKPIPSPLKPIENLQYSKIIGKWGDIKLHRENSET